MELFHRKRNTTRVYNVFERYDIFIIWANGLKYKDDILKKIEDNENFTIITAMYYRPSSIKELINHVYDFEYAPKVHLVSKAKYLYKYEKMILYVLIKNTNPQEMFVGEGKYLHIESKSIKEFKESIRNEFNRYVDGKRTEEHVIHGTDCEEQVDGILRYIRKKDGLMEFSKTENSILPIPYHLGSISEFSIQSVDMDDLYTKILSDRGAELLRISETPQFRHISEGSDAYEQYLKKYLFVRLGTYFSVDKLNRMAKTLTYESYLQSGKFIIVRREGKTKDKLVIRDGVHRAAILYYQGLRKILVAEVKAEWI